MLTNPLLVADASPRSIVALTRSRADVVHIRGLGPGAWCRTCSPAMKVERDRGPGRARIRDRRRRRRAARRAAASVGPVSWLLALVPVMFSYSGWNAAAYVAEEVRDPSRNVPLALGLGTVDRRGPLRAAQRALSSSRCRSRELAALPGGRLMDTVAERLFGFAAGNLLALFTIVSIAASISAMVLAGPRVYFAMARDGMFVRAAGSRPPALSHAGHRDRRAGRVEQRAGALGHAVAARDLHRIRGRAVLRRRGQRAVRAAPPRAAAPRPFSALGYPWAPALFVLASAGDGGERDLAQRCRPPAPASRSSPRACRCIP